MSIRANTQSGGRGWKNRTGALQKSLRSFFDPGRMVAGIRFRPYGQYIDKGTSTIRPRNFVMRAFRDRRQALVEALRSRGLE